MKNKAIIFGSIIMISGLFLACGKRYSDFQEDSSYQNLLPDSENEETITEPEEPTEPEEETTPDISFYDSEQYGELETVTEHFNDSDNEEVYYFEVDCYQLKDSRYERVNETLNSIYQEKIAEYRENCEKYSRIYKADMSIENVYQRVNYYRWFLAGVTFVGTDYVSFRFNDIEYYAGAAHPASYFTPVTIRVDTGETVTPEEVLGCTQDEVKNRLGDKMGLEYGTEEFYNDYGFYLTDNYLVFTYRYIQDNEVYLER